MKIYCFWTPSSLYWEYLRCFYFYSQELRCLYFPGSPSGKEFICQCKRCKEAQVRSLGQEEPLEEGMATHSSILAWRIPWMEEPGGPQSIGSQRIRHSWSDGTHVHTRERLQLLFWAFCFSVSTAREAKNKAAKPWVAGVPALPLLFHPGFIEAQLMVEKGHL